MKTLVLIIVSTFISVQSLAKEKSHREHGAHHHGAGTLGIAFEETTGRLEFKIPSESVIGFEYTPKTEKDKKTKETQLAKLENNVAGMVVFDSSLKCQILKDKIEVIKDEQEAAGAHGHHRHHAEHSDVLATFNVNCEKSIVGTKMIFNVQKYFPRVHDLDVQIIAGPVQKSVEAKKNGTSIELKP